MMEMTTSISTSVKPRRLLLRLKSRFFIANFLCGGEFIQGNPHRQPNALSMFWASIKTLAATDHGPDY